MDINKVLNALIAALIPTLNTALPKLIVSEKLDPWPEVLSGTDTLGKIDLEVCTASVKASYAIKNMVGLSSIVITGMTLQTVDSSKMPIVTGVMNLSATLNKSLSAKLSGGVTAKCGIVGGTEKISGTAKATGVTGSGQASFTANLALPQSCLNEVKITTLKLDYKDIEVKIDGLGFLNEFLKPLVDLIDELFGNAIKGEIAAALKPVLNDLMKDELPLCISTDEN